MHRNGIGSELIMISANEEMHVRGISVYGDSAVGEEQPGIEKTESASRLSLTGKRLLIFSRILPPPGSTEAV